MSRAEGDDVVTSADGATEFSALLEDSAEDIYEHAPCGHLSTLMDGTIAKINSTLLDWLGHHRDDLVGKRRLADLLSVGGRIYHETHIAPMLRMHGEVGGLALDLRAADGTRLPVLVTSVVKTGTDGTPQLVRTTFFNARNRRAYEQELLRARHQAEQERDRALTLATTLQRTLLPAVLPTVPGVDVAAYYHPAATNEIGGDFYDLFPLRGDTWGFFLGDVSGKGPEAAVITSLIRYTLRAAAVSDPNPITMLRTLNTVLHNEYGKPNSHFCTIILGLLTPDDDGCAITMITGGHPPATLVQADGHTRFVEITGGQLVGALPNARFADIHLRLAPGDTLLLYTDGLTEAHAPDGTRYSEDDLLAFLHAEGPGTAATTVAAVTDLLTSFGSGVDDDTALLALSIPHA